MKTTNLISRIIPHSELQFTLPKPETAENQQTEQIVLPSFHFWVAKPFVKSLKAGDYLEIKKTAGDVVVIAIIESIEPDPCRGGSTIKAIQV